MDNQKKLNNLGGNEVGKFVRNNYYINKITKKEEQKKIQIIIWKI